MEAHLPYALTAYGLPHRMGYLPTRDGTLHPSPLSATAFLDLAVGYGLRGVEFPLPKPEVMSLEALRDALNAQGLRIVVDSMGVLDQSEEALRSDLRGAAAVGAKVLRVILSRILCGDRRTLPGGWPAHLDALTERLREVLPLAADLGLCIAVENHQDAATEDLLLLAERLDHHPAFGITFDTGNPLAVGQDPVEAARQLAPLIRHLHLKDYTIHFAPEGYRLVRCANGDGVIDFKAILAIVRANGHKVLPGIEIAAQATRTIPILDPGWWEHHAPRTTTSLLPVLQLLWKRGVPQHVPYGSAWERGESSECVAREEWDVMAKSVAWFRALQV